MEQTIQQAQVICSQCNKQIIKDPDSISTGYGQDKDGNKICFECCGVNDKKHLIEMAVGDRTSLYLSKTTEYDVVSGNNAREVEVTYVSNWPSSFKIKIHYVRKGRHNFAGIRRDFWFSVMEVNDHEINGKQIYETKWHEFHGYVIGNNTEVAHIVKLKPKNVKPVKVTQELIDSHLDRIKLSNLINETNK